MSKTSGAEKPNYLPSVLAIVGLVSALATAWADHSRMVLKMGWLIAIYSVCGVAVVLAAVLHIRARRHSTDVLAPKQHILKIRRAIYLKYGIDHTDCAPSYLCYNTDFEDFLLKDKSRAWVVQEIPNTTVMDSLRDQITCVSKTVESKYNNTQEVAVIVLVHRSLSLPEKGDLLRQLEEVKTERGLSAKLSFKVWDINDLSGPA